MMHKKIMKIIAAGLVAALLCFAAPAVADQAAPLQLTLPAAIELALERSLDLQKAELELDAAELAQRQAKSAADDLPSQLAVSYDLKKVKEVYPYQARVMAETAKGGVAQAEGVRYGVTAPITVCCGPSRRSLCRNGSGSANEQLRLANCISRPAWWRKRMYWKRRCSRPMPRRHCCRPSAGPKWPGWG